jgi:hypothetical protein
LSCRFLSDEHLFPQQKAVGHRFFLRPSTRPFRSPYCSGLLYECVCVTPSLFHVTSTYWKHASGTSPLDLPLVGVSTFLEGPVASPDHVQVEDSSGSHGALSSLQAPGSVLQRLDVHLHLRLEGFFLLWIPVHPTRLHRRHVFALLRHDFIFASSLTRRSGACETWVPMGPHRPGS